MKKASSAIRVVTPCRNNVSPSNNYPLARQYSTFLLILITPPFLWHHIQSNISPSKCRLNFAFRHILHSLKLIKFSSKKFFTSKYEYKIIYQNLKYFVCWTLSQINFCFKSRNHTFYLINLITKKYIWFLNYNYFSEI